MRFYSTQEKTEEYKKKMRSNDRMLVVKPIAGKVALSTGGLLDTRLFTAEKPTLRAIKGPFDNLWRLKYNEGILPQPLKQAFTSFDQLLTHAKGYFTRRNLEITEVIDDYESSYA